MIHFLTIGAVLGLAAGFAPGPLLTLVISETLQHDIKAGFKVALAPFLTDLPIIFLTLLVLSKLSGFHSILGVMTLLGGCFVLYLGYEGLCTRGIQLSLPASRPNSLFKGVLTNFLSPHPYLFWLSVGAPTMTRAINQNFIAAVAFIVAFYGLLVGSKVLLAVIVGKSKTFLSGITYIYTMRFLGLVLCALAMFLFYDGLKLLGLV